jgi:hypothetical protein
MIIPSLHSSRRRSKPVLDGGTPFTSSESTIIGDHSGAIGLKMIEVQLDNAAFITSFNACSVGRSCFGFGLDAVPRTACRVAVMMLL